MKDNDDTASSASSFVQGGDLRNARMLAQAVLVGIDAVGNAPRAEREKVANAIIAFLGTLLWTAADGLRIKSPDFPTLDKGDDDYVESDPVTQHLHRVVKKYGQADEYEALVRFIKRVAPLVDAGAWFEIWTEVPKVLGLEMVWDKGVSRLRLLEAEST